MARRLDPGPRTPDGLLRRQAEIEQRVSVGIAQLEVPARGDGDIFLPIKLKRHRRRVNRRSGPELPEEVTGLRVKRSFDLLLTDAQTR